MGQYVKGPNGDIQLVDDGQLSHFIASGYQPVAEGEAGNAATQFEKPSGLGSSVAAGLSSLASGATLGLSDVALKELLDKGQTDYVAASREAHPYLSTAGQLAGAIALNPLGEVGGAISDLGAGRGFLARTGANIAAGAAEGAGYGAGGYVSDVALGNKDLSADGFVGAMGNGALWGGVAGGALSAGGDAVRNARKLFSRAELAPENVASVVKDAGDKIEYSLNQADMLDMAAARKLRAARAEASAADPMVAAKLEDAGARASQELEAARIPRGLEDIQEARIAPEDVGELGTKDIPGEALLSSRFRTFGEDLPAWATEASDADLFSGAALRRPKVAGFGNKEPALPKFALPKSVGDAAVPFGAAPAGAGDDLMSQLSGTLDQVQAGTSLSKVKPTHVEDSLNAELAKVNPDVKQLLDKQAELRESTEQIKQILQGPPKAEGGDVISPTGEIDLHKLTGDHGFDVDLDKAADAITRHESASADLAEHLGPEAPPGALDSAQAFRAAQQAAEIKSSQAIAETASHFDRVQPHLDNGSLPFTADSYAGKVNDAGVSTLGGEVPAKTAGKTAGKAVKGADKLAGYEMARMLGIPIPSLHSIPVIGPVLHAVAKAKLLQAAYKRLLKGEIAQTAETTIAAKSNGTVNRIESAIDAVFDGAKKAGKYLPATPAGPAAILAHKLFDDGPPAKGTYSSEGEKDDVLTLFNRRAAELVASQRPGAVAEAVKARIKTDDPAVVDAVIAAQQRKLDFLYSKLPKPQMADNPVKDGSTFVPSKSQIQDLCNYVKAAEDPAHVWEKIYRGELITPCDVETLHAVYPNLTVKGVSMLTKKAMSGNAKVPYKIRVQLSVLTGGAYDHSMLPEMRAYLQGGYKAPPPASAPGGAGRLGSPMKGNPVFKDTTSTRLDR